MGPSGGVGCWVVCQRPFRGGAFGGEGLSVLFWGWATGGRYVDASLLVLFRVVTWGSFFIWGWLDGGVVFRLRHGDDIFRVLDVSLASGAGFRGSGRQFEPGKPGLFGSGSS